MANHPTESVFETALPAFPLLHRGKVRDVYDLGDSLLIVATDRLSAFDCILPDPIPDKGKVLNQIAAFWFRKTAAVIANHVIATEVSEFPVALRGHSELLAGRATLARKLEMIPVECVARGYLAGSGFKEYQQGGTICGIALPAGLRESDRLPEPVFTPSTKATSGHDENIPFSEVEKLVGRDRALQLRDKTLELYRFAAQFALTRGILIADTKLEFGLERGELVVADEMFTPDSSRFWPADKYQPGRPQPSFDKQYVRDHLESVGWNKRPPVPRIPASIVEGTRERYIEIFRILTGASLR